MALLGGLARRFNWQNCSTGRNVPAGKNSTTPDLTGPWGRPAFGGNVHFNLADLFELVTDTVGDREALICGDRRLTYADLDERVNRLAHVLADKGVERGQHVGLYLYNGTEYVEAMMACYKLGAVPININYRYVAAELVYLFNDADLVALVHHQEFAPTIAEVRHQVDGISTFLCVADDSGATRSGLDSLDYETELASASPERDFDERSPDDLYILYTGGTTGMPKGVMWRQEDIFFGALGGGSYGGTPIKAPAELTDHIGDNGIAMLTIAPLMHGAAQWSTFIGFFMGNTIVLSPQRKFDGAEIWQLICDEKVVSVSIVGDAMGRPLVEALAADPDRYDVSNVMVIGSGGAIWSEGVKTQYRTLLPNAMLMDNYGSSETGSQGGTPSIDAGESDGAPRFQMDDTHTVLDENLQPIEPGSGTKGHVARSGHIPLGYYGDPEKTATTFVEIDGKRWVLQGDVATIEADGFITLFGRGSICINSGGEKIFPEEVEGALKQHPDVYDALVVGVPDDRFGERVAAVIQPRAGTTVDLDSLQAFAREHVAGYKVPRQLALVEMVQRSPSGKADYRWAKQTAIDAG